MIVLSQMLMLKCPLKSVVKLGTKPETAAPLSVGVTPAGISVTETVAPDHVNPFGSVIVAVTLVFCARATSGQNNNNSNAAIRLLISPLALILRSLHIDCAGIPRTACSQCDCKS